MLNTIVNFRNKKLITSIMVLSTLLGSTPIVLAAGGNSSGSGTGGGHLPLTFLDTNLCTINSQTQTATPGVSLINNANVPPGQNTIEIQIDKNIVSDTVYNGQTVYAHDQSSVTLEDLTKNSNVPISPYRLGDGTPADMEKQHLFFDVNLTSGDSYEIKIDASLIANNGLTLGTTKYVDFTVQAADTQQQTQTPAPVTTPKTTVAERIGGVDRYDTAVKIAQDYFPNGSDTAILARGDISADALTAVPLAKHFNAPLLLTPQNKLPDEVLTELKTLGAKTVYIIGGEMAVSTNIADVITAQGITVQRIAGSDRYTTAYDVAKLLGSTGQAVIVNGNSFPDALSISSWAAYNGVPILYADGTNKLPAVTAQALSEFKVTKTILIGGTGVLPKSLESLVPNPVRYAGADRFATNSQVLSNLQPDSTQVFAATGSNFADALAGAAVAGQTDAWVILTGSHQSSGSGLTANQQQVLQTAKGRISAVHVFGGIVAVPDADLSGIKVTLGIS